MTRFPLSSWPQSCEKRTVSRLLFIGPGLWGPGTGSWVDRDSSRLASPALRPCLGTVPRM